MTINKALYSSKKHNWMTPKEVLDVVREVGPIDLDPCPARNIRHWFANVNWLDFGEKFNQQHAVRSLAFMNPPYGNVLKIWVNRFKAIMDSKARHGIMLVPSRTDTEWFRSIWYYGDAYCLWSGRIKFVGAPHPAPFPSVLFYAGPNPHRFCDVFQRKGIVGLIS